MSSAICSKAEGWPKGVWAFGQEKERAENGMDERMDEWRETEDGGTVVMKARRFASVPRLCSVEQGRQNCGGGGSGERFTSRHRDWSICNNQRLQGPYPSMCF